MPYDDNSPQMNLPSRENVIEAERNRLKNGIEVIQERMGSVDRDIRMHQRIVAEAKTVFRALEKERDGMFNALGALDDEAQGEEAYEEKPERNYGDIEYLDKRPGRY